MFLPMEVLKAGEHEKCQPCTLDEAACSSRFATGSLAGACAGFLAGSIMFLQGSFVKMFVKIKVLQSPGMKCQCTYGVTIPRQYLQVAGRW